MKKYIYIEADYNDGDYTSSMSEITDEELELIRPVVEAISSNKGSYLTGDCLDDDRAMSPEKLYGHLEGFDLFEDVIPSAEYGIHTINEVKIVQILEELY